ncbi:alpha-2-macroglobulin [Frateuria sp. Soil773]|uniref:alpha-2-macroglobulin family protein n=1 Tax=Frateuria sp. Soil773 TaxID=1736407 RepID=UPI0006F90AE8|nr:alpha-2-macroglobulin [Frateuria sp. Soil773]KRE89129.1 alpha-2-macroglobulin [Frateuria sp. Soil773]
MDLLRFLLLLPVRLVRGLLYGIAWILRPLVGSVAWSAPAWMPASAAAVRRRPLHFAGALAALVILAAGGWFGWQWYRNRPKPVEPDRITFEVKAPAITDYTAATISFHPLVVEFSGSAAPIEKSGKPVTEGIVLEPALKGAWRWTDDHTLRFEPAEDWPVGRHYAVRFDKSKVFAGHVLMAEDHFGFQTRPFEAKIGNGEFYQDPQDATAKKTIVPVNFNYPVDPAQFEKRIALALLDRNGKRGPALKYTVTYDQYKLNAWVHSQPLDLPRDDGAVSVRIDKGVRSSRGGDGSAEPLEGRVRIPGLYSLAINDINPTLVDNDKYEPEQVLVMDASGSIRGEDLAALTKAWVLPARKPGVEQAEDDPPYGWSVSEVGEDVLRRSQPLKLELVPTENDYEAVQSFRYQATPGQRIYVRTDKGLKSFGGYVLGHPRSEAVTVPDYPRLLRFMADGSLLSLSGSKRVSVVSRNLPGMRLRIGRVLPDQLQHLVSLNQGNYSHPDLGYGFSEDHLVERYEQKLAFPQNGPSKAHYEGIDLGQYLKEGRRGVFLLHLSGYDPVKAKKQADAAAKAKADAENDHAPPADDADEAAQDGDSEGDDGSMPTDTRLVVITDLGMLVKRALDGSQDVFVQSIRSGQPVDGASVSVLAINGQTLYTQATGADGVVHFPSLKGLEREKKPVMYVVKKGEDLSFLPIGSYDRQLDYSRFDIGGERNAVNQGQLSGYLFSDRGIYRPGDTFHIGLIVRAASWTRSVAGIPLQAEVVDPRGVTVKQLPLEMDQSGFGELSYAPAETAPTGTWTVNLYIVKDGKAGAQIGSTTVQVKEFLPDRMKVTAKLSQQVPEGWVKPDQLKGLVDVQNLFGTPAADRRVEASLTLRPAWPAFHSWPDYHFYDVRRAKEGYEEALQDGKTDEQGRAEFALDLKKYADATYQLYFLSKAYEAEGGRSVAAAAQTLVSSNDWLVGYKAADSLDYVNRGASRSVRLVAIDPQAKSIALGGLKAQLVERRFVSVLTKQDSGVYKYESKAKEIPVSEQPLNIAAGGMDYALPTDKPGSYALVIRRADRTEVNRIEYSVAGAANVSRSLDRNAELQLNLDKQDYAPGETVEIAVRAPYAGSGLITIERDKVYAHAWFHADTTSSVQHIAVPADFEGNGYVNVQYIRDPSSDEVFMSPLSYGVVPFSVNLDARRNPLTVDAPALAKPGEKVTFKLHATQPTRAVVFAVDEGILQVARYKLGDPLKFFFRKRMLEVNTAQILDLILPDFEKLMAMAAPGGDADAAIGRQLNPFKRKRDKPVAYWSGIVDVDGEKDLDYTVPDYFNGKLRVMAVAVSPERIGTFEGATTVRGDFVLSPNVPTTLAPGDEAEVSVGVANNLTGLGGKQVPVAVTLKTGPQLQLVGNATQSLSLGEMREGVALFRVKATDKLGSANLTFTAGYGDKSAKQSVDLSVRPASTWRTVVHVGRVAANGKGDVAGLRTMYDAYAKRDAAISSLPLVLAQGLTAYLVDFPHYCTEQVLSRAMPALVFGQRPEFRRVLKSSDQTGGASEADALAGLYDVLHTRQNGQGGFGLWTATPDANAFLTDYAMHFMLEARDRGLGVPRDMFDAGNAYLKQIAGDEGADSLDSLRQRAYAVYLLTRQGMVTTNYLAAVQKRLQEGYAAQWKDDLAAAWLAASYQLLKQDREANQLIAGPLRLLTRTTRDKDWQYGYYYDPLVRDASVLYLLAKHFPERLKNLPPAALDNIVAPLQQGSFNTLSSSMTVLALDAYAGNAPGNADQLGIGAVQANGSVQPVGKAEGMLQTATWGAGIDRLRFTDASNLPAWYVVSEGGYDRAAPAKALREGIEIVRDYTDVDGKALDQVGIGQEIDVHVKIRATGEQGVGDVAIVDLLPGGFEPVIEPAPPVTDKQEGEDGEDAGGDSEVDASAWRSPIGLSSSTWQPEYADIREDRVVIYGDAIPDVREFVYRIKATNAGKFVVPPAYGESLYDRRVQARSPGGGTLTVVRKP